ncbi:hypothetical protein ACFQ0X_22000 [Streptomyces rectiviolaceus]
MGTSSLPDDIDVFMNVIGQNVKASGGFVFEEKQLIKTEMEYERGRWLQVSPSALRDKCAAIGLSDAEATLVVGWLGNVHEGKHLRPDKARRDHRYQWPTP